MNEILKMALDYYARGFSLIPVRLMDKRPLCEWTEFQKRRPSEAEIVNWFQNGDANIAIVTGSISNVSVVDLDDDAAIEYFKKNDFKESPVVKTFRGHHIYYKYNQAIKTSTHINNFKIDIRSDRGYVVAPPSFNEKGVRYEWVDGFGLDDLPLADFPMELLSTKDVPKRDTPLVELYSGVPEGQRNASLVRLLGSWLRDGLSEPDCLEMAFIWNARNLTPLPDEEVITTVSGAYKRYADHKVSTPTNFLTSLHDLLNEPDELLPWVVKDTLPLGGSSIIVAKPKVGKSTVVRQGMLCVANGAPFLNRATTAGPIIYIALEEKRSEIRRHFRDMGATGAELIFISTSIGKENPILNLTNMIDEVHPVWVVIDPLFKFVKVRDGNAYSEMSQAIEAIHNLARKANLHITLIHHSTKGDRSGGDGILGSTAIFGGVDTAIIMKCDANSRRIYSIQRYGVDIPESVITFDSVTRTVSLGISQAAATAVSIEQSILGVLKLQNQPITENAISQKVKGEAGAKSLALRSLVASGAVVRTGQGKKGNPYLYAIKPDVDKTPAEVSDINFESDFSAQEFSDDMFTPSETTCEDFTLP